MMHILFFLAPFASRPHALQCQESLHRQTLSGQLEYNTTWYQGNDAYQNVW